MEDIVFQAAHFCFLIDFASGLDCFVGRVPRGLAPPDKSRARECKPPTDVNAPICIYHCHRAHECTKMTNVDSDVVLYGCLDYFDNEGGYCEQLYSQSNFTSIRDCIEAAEDTDSQPESCVHVEKGEVCTCPVSLCNLAATQFLLQQISIMPALLAYLCLTFGSKPYCAITFSR